MLYYVFLLLVKKWSFFNVFRYITFRSFCAIITTFILGLCLCASLLKVFTKMQQGGQPIRSDGPESHVKTKGNVPTMGGVMIAGSTAVGSLLWADLTNAYVWILMVAMLSFGVIGLVDDYYKLKFRNSRGIKALTKLCWQSLCALMLCMCVVYVGGDVHTTELAVPFLKSGIVNMGYFYLPFVVIVVVGASNAVNLTDGLDGLAIGSVVIAVACFIIITYIVGNAVFANYLQFCHIPGVGELSVFCSALIGASLAFLWYNAHPAKIFMGDVGSLSLGAIIGLLSVVTRHELVLVVIGGLFVVEAVSVILQVVSYKLRRKRIFLMAPIHHHFEKLGWSESAIVIRFWIIAMFCALIGLATLKLR